MVDPQRNRGDRHAVRLNGEQTVNVFIEAIVIARSLWIRRGRREQGDDDGIIAGSQQSARRKDGLLPVLIGEDFCTIKDLFVFRLFACVVGRKDFDDLVERIADADGARSVAYAQTPVAADLFKLRGGQIAGGKRRVGVIGQERALCLFLRRICCAG